MSTAGWSVKNRVVVNLFTVVLLVAGFVTAGSRLQMDLFPDISTNFINVTTVDITTSVPEDIERTITVPIEEELSNVEGLTRIRSFSQDNLSTIFIEVDSAITDLDPVLNDVRQAVDLARSKLPKSVEDPIVESFDIPFPIINFTFSYPPGTDLREVRPIFDNLERRFKLVPGVSKVLTDGLEDREVWVDVNPFRLQGLGVPFSEVVSAVARKNQNSVGGRLDGTGGQRVVRVLGEIRSAGELEQTPVRAGPGGLVLLRDIATVKETTARAETMGRVDLRPAVTFSLVKQKGEDVLKTVAKARKIFEEEAAKLPRGFEARAVADSTKFIKTRVETVMQNGIQALILVTVLLILLLNWRLAVVVAVGIPVSFAGCFLVLYMTGNSINLLSLFAMIMALGMVVDDTIVISENVYRYYQNGLSPVQAAIQGAGEVFWPVLGSVSTTVAAFLPLIWGEGIIGKFLAVVPLVVISALLFSLLQAYLGLPSHLSDFVRINRASKDIRAELAGGTVRGLRRLAMQFELTYAEMRASVDCGLGRVVQVYLHLLTLSLRLRYLVIAGFFVMLMAMGVALALGVVKFQLFAADFADQVMVKLELPADYSLEETVEEVRRVEERIVTEFPSTDLVTLITRVGAQLDATDQFLEYGSNLAMITLDINEQNSKCRKPSEIERHLRTILASFNVFVRATARAEQGGPPVGRAVNAEIQGADFGVMREIAADLEARLAGLEGVVNVGNDFPRGKTEFQIFVEEDRAARAGLDVTAIGDELRAGFRGIEAARLRWGNDEVRVRVKMDERFAHDPEMLAGYRIVNSRGEVTELGNIARVIRTAGIARVKRVNQERVLAVSADVDDRIITSAAVNERIRQWIPELLAGRAGVGIQLTGENEDTEKSVDAMKFSSIIALLLIYTLLAWITNSFFQPFIIMSVIPFAIVGVFIGLIFMGEPLGLMSIMGTIALAGIVVNNSVIFVDFMNRFRHSHSHLRVEADAENLRQQPRVLTSWVRWRSIMASGQTRFRPIFLTTATTVAGLLSLAFTSSGQEQFLAPMAQAIVFGLSFATLITMVLIPCLYAIFDDVRRVVARIFGITSSRGEA